MEKIVWEDCFSVNHGVLDQHHKQMIVYINEVIDAVYGSAMIDRMKVLSVLPKINELAALHFKEEEHYLATSGYPDFERHTDQHEHYADRISHFYMQSPDDIDLTTLSELLHDWWINHIIVDGMAYKRYFEDQGSATPK